MNDTIIVAGERPLEDPIGWAAENTGLLGEGFEVLARNVPHSGGPEIPLVGCVENGTIALVEACSGNEADDCHRIARGLAFVRARKDWLSGIHPDRHLKRFESPRLILLGFRFSSSFRELLSALAHSGAILLRLRNVVDVRGRSHLLVEDESDRPPARSGHDSRLTPEEEEFFGGLERECLLVRRQGGAA
jgi:hypothetical protein